MLVEKENYFAHIYAIFLLAQFREQLIEDDSIEDDYIRGEAVKALSCVGTASKNRPHLLHLLPVLFPVALIRRLMLHERVPAPGYVRGMQVFSGHFG